MFRGTFVRNGRVFVLVEGYFFRITLKCLKHAYMYNVTFAFFMMYFFTLAGTFQVRLNFEPLRC